MSIGLDYENSPFENQEFPHIIDAWIVENNKALVLFKTHEYNQHRYSWALFKADAPIYSVYVCYVPSMMHSKEAVDNRYVDYNEKAGILSGGTWYGLTDTLNKMEKEFGPFEKRHIISLSQRNKEINENKQSIKEHGHFGTEKLAGLFLSGENDAKPST